MSIKSVFSALAAPALIAGLLAASPVSAQEEKPLKTFRVQDMPKRWNGYELLFLADKKGYFKEQGLKLELVPLPIDQYTIAVDSGVTDFALSADYIYFANIKAKGLKMKEIVSSNPIQDPSAAGEGVFVLKDSPIKTPEDLRGKKIGVRNVGFSAAWFTLDYIGRKGVRKDEVQLLTIPDLQLEQVLQSGAVDAVYAYGPIDAQLRARGNYRQLFQISDLAGRPIQRGGTIAREEFIAKNPEVIRGYVAAIGKAADYASAHPREVVELGLELGRLSPEVAPLLYTKTAYGDFSGVKWPARGVINGEDVKFWLEVAESQGIVPKGVIKSEDLYTNEYNAFSKEGSAVR